VPGHPFNNQGWPNDSFTSSDCHGFQNPHGLRVGVAGVGVRVGFF
jgi:hypothetical protein